MKYCCWLFFLIWCDPAFSQTEKYWIFFTDKPQNTTLQKSIAEKLPERTIQRRLKNSDTIVDKNDLPLNSVYLQTLESAGVRIQNQSKWFNAVTAYLDATLVQTLRQFPFVQSIRPVAKGIQDQIVLSKGFPKIESQFDLSYGSSLRQNAFINTIEAHRLGYSGKGVIIGMIDTGFNLTHDAFDSIEVIGQYDFVEKDADVSEPAGPKGGNSHGTRVLSTIAGYAEGALIGTAFGASYLLARTEDDDGIGLKAEEDQWIAGLEWLEENGADIVSSSISFFDEFQNATNNYSLSDLNGKTALTTLATNIAFDKGVLVFNSAGNMGDRGPKYLGTPSDGKKMIAVGAAYGDSTRTDFGSHGPTADGRKKPDVTALGKFVRVVSTANNTGYDNFDGTSLSTPLVAGLAALALEAHPDWSAKQLYDAIRNTSSQAKHPDNEIGYGIPDAVKAINYSGGSSKIAITDIKNFPNPSNSGVQFSFKPLINSTYSMAIYNVLGEKISEIASNEPTMANQVINKFWDGKNTLGREISSGVYFYRITMDGESITKKIVILK